MSTAENDPASPPAVASSEASNKEESIEVLRIDEITAVQDSIDGLSLAMFEALRGLRDAVAPESGNIGGTSDGQDDFDEFWHSYRNGDEEIVALVEKASGGVAPQKREDAIRLHAKIKMEKDRELVSRLASTVLQKSADIDERVAALPGMNRTKTQQMERISELLELNHEAAAELEKAHALAKTRRDEVRESLRELTSKALGIDEER